MRTGKVEIATEEALRYRKMARQCGTWAAARRMAKDGYPVEVASIVLSVYAWWRSPAFGELRRAA